MKTKIICILLPLLGVFVACDNEPEVTKNFRTVEISVAKNIKDTIPEVEEWFQLGFDTKYTQYNKEEWTGETVSLDGKYIDIMSEEKGLMPIRTYTIKQRKIKFYLQSRFVDKSLMGDKLPLSVAIYIIIKIDGEIVSSQAFRPEDYYAYFEFSY